MMVYDIQVTSFSDDRPLLYTNNTLFYSYIHCTIVMLYKLTLLPLNYYNYSGQYQRKILQKVTILYQTGANPFAKIYGN